MPPTPTHPLRHRQAPAALVPLGGYYRFSPLYTGAATWFAVQARDISYPVAQQIQPNPAAAGSWQSLPALAPGSMVTASHAPLRLELPSQQRLTISAASTVTLSEHPADPSATIMLQAGTAKLDRLAQHDLNYTIAAHSGTFAASASATVTRNRFRDRLMIAAGTVDWRRHDGLFMTLAAGTSYDIANTPRTLSPLLRSYLPLTIDSASPLSENQLKRLSSTVKATAETAAGIQGSVTASNHTPLAAPFLWRHRRMICAGN